MKRKNAKQIDYLAGWLGDLIGKTDKQRLYYSSMFDGLLSLNVFEPDNETWIKAKTREKLNGNLLNQKVIKMRRFSDKKVYYELHPNFKGNLQSIVDVI